MFDFENPFKDAIDQAEEEILDEEFDEATAEPDWENAEWEEVCNRPARNAEAGTVKSNRGRKKYVLIEAIRHAGLALCCGMLAYACANYGINWLVWILGCAGGAFAIVSSYCFGIAHEMSR